MLYSGGAAAHLQRTRDLVDYCAINVVNIKSRDKYSINFMIQPGKYTVTSFPMSHDYHEYDQIKLHSDANDLVVEKRRKTDMAQLMETKFLRITLIFWIVFFSDSNAHHTVFNRWQDITMSGPAFESLRN